MDREKEIRALKQQKFKQQLSEQIAFNNTLRTRVLSEGRQAVLTGLTPEPETGAANELLEKKKRQ